MKLLVPAEGEILINDISYDDLDEKSVRQVVSVLKQDPDFFLDLSIAENIAYGDNFRTVPYDEIIAAGKFALVHEQIDEMPEKYDTKVRDLPVNPETYALRQRIAIARAVVRNPKVVVVYEMTVSVDTESDNLLMNALMKLRKGRTLIVISQRIDPVRRAKTIVVLKDEMVAEIGTDKELFHKRGLYYEMLMSQQLYERSTDDHNAAAISYHSVNSGSSYERPHKVDGR
jgi:ABC-type multidrug transport system fused ATPase/permease subunit